MNPNQMTSPHPKKNSVPFPKSSATGPAKGWYGVARVHQHRQLPYEWSFSGLVRSEAHYNDLLEWTAKTGKVHITDHFERTWEVRVDSLELDEQRDTARNAWRFQYTVKVIIYGRVS
jgi:hypothetical protein